MRQEGKRNPKDIDVFGIEQTVGVRFGSQSSSIRILPLSNAFLIRAAVSVRFATLIITGGTRCPCFNHAVPTGVRRATSACREISPSTVTFQWLFGGGCHFFPSNS